MRRRRTTTRSLTDNCLDPLHRLIDLMREPTNMKARGTRTLVDLDPRTSVPLDQIHCSTLAPNDETDRIRCHWDVSINHTLVLNWKMHHLSL